MNVFHIALYTRKIEYRKYRLNSADAVHDSIQPMEGQFKVIRRRWYDFAEDS